MCNYMQLVNAVSLSLYVRRLNGIKGKHTLAHTHIHTHTHMHTYRHTIHKNTYIAITMIFIVTVVGKRFPYS